MTRDGSLEADQPPHQGRTSQHETCDLASQGWGLEYVAMAQAACSPEASCPRRLQSNSDPEGLRTSEDNYFLNLHQASIHPADIHTYSYF